MKKNAIRFAMAIIVVAIAVLTVNNSRNNMTAGGGLSLKEMVDTTKMNVTVIAEGNITSEQELAQVTGIASWEHQYSNGLFTGFNVVGCVSTEYGVACPTCVATLGANLNIGRVEIKCGNFAANGIKTTGFDPQFSNYTINCGENFQSMNAIQVAFIANSTKIYAGHRGGSSFYKFNTGNYYLGGEQRIGNLAIGGGVDLTSDKSGYAAAKWQTKNNSLTATANNLGKETKNYIISYNRSNINVGKKIGLNIASALFFSSAKNGLHTSLGFHKGSNNLFAQLGYTFGGSPLLGLGYSRKL